MSAATAPRPTDAAPPRPLAPLGGAVVDAAAPAFRWEPTPGAHRYRLQIAADRQFTQDVVEVDAGPSTQLALHDLVPVQAQPLFWRVRAETAAGLTRWSPYGRFVPGPDAAVEVFRERAAREAAEARRAAARRRAAEQEERDLLPWHERPDLVYTDGQVRALGLAFIIAGLLTGVVIFLVATLG